MSQNQAIIMCVIVVILSIAAIIFFKNKYAKQAGSILPVAATPDAVQQEFTAKEKLHLDKIADLEAKLLKSSGVPAGYVAQSELDNLLAKTKSDKDETTKLSASLNQSIAQINNEKNLVEKQVSSLKSTIGELSDERDLLSKRVASLEEANQAASQDSRVSELEAALSQVHEEKSQLASSLENAKLSEEKSKSEVVDLQNTVNSLEQEKNQFQTALEEKNALVTQIADLQNTVNSLEQEKNQFQIALEEKNALVTQIADLQNTVNSLEQEKNQFQTALEEKNALVTQIADLQSNVNALNQDKQSLEDTVASQAKIIEEKSVITTEVVQDSIIKSILVVDDSLVVRNKMKKLLENNGYDIVTANDGLEALEKLPSKEFSLVITDLEMPNLDGFGLIRKISEDVSMKDIPIMAITGHEEIKVQVSQSESLYSVHKKPWKDEDILKKIESLTKVK